MGNTISFKDCVNVEQLRELTQYDDYTVLRTSGELDSGWIIGPTRVAANWINQHALKREGIWRVFLNNGQGDPNLALYAWRHLDKIFPSSMKGQEAEILVWRETVIAKLEDLEIKRVAESAAYDAAAAEVAVPKPAGPRKIPCFCGEPTCWHIVN